MVLPGVCNSPHQVTTPPETRSDSEYCVEVAVANLGSSYSDLNGKVSIKFAQYILPKCTARFAPVVIRYFLKNCGIDVSSYGVLTLMFLLSPGHCWIYIWEFVVGFPFTTRATLCILDGTLQRCFVSKKEKALVARPSVV